MPRTEHSQSFSVSSQRTKMNETERLQDDADKYTKKYEWERRNLMALKTTEAQLQHELATLKNSVAKLKKDCDVGEVKVMFTKQRNLQKQIDSVTFLDYIRTTNDIMRLWEILIS